jgi:phosphomannomutase
MVLKVSVSGIRGIVGETLDAESVSRFAAAFGAWLPPGPIVVARDSRISGPMLSMAVQSALLSTGHDVIDAGLLSTPATEYLVQESDAVGGVIVTASHNPIEWNALKLLRSDGLFLSAPQLTELMEYAEAPRRPHRSAVELGALMARTDGERLHREAILALDVVDADAVRRAGLRVAVDCVEGAGGYALPRLLESMGVEVLRLHCGCTGRFPRDPEPRAEHLGELAEKVAQEEADLGLAVDPDVDRLSLVDRGGRALSEELTLAVAADHVLGSRAHGSTDIVVNLSTSLVMEHVAERHGATLHRTPVGEANVVARMLELGAVIGGEGNGGVIFPSLHPGRDAILGAAIVLCAVARRGSLSACLEGLPPAHMVKEKIELRPQVDDPRLWRDALASLGSDGQWNESDGIRLALPGRWVHLRRSNTENALRVIAEAPDPETADNMIRSVRARLEA